MAVFISVTTSAFGELDARRQPYTGVRRPMRGLQRKEDTYAIMRVLTAQGEEVALFDSGAFSGDTVGEDVIGRSERYSNFIIQQIQDQRMEKKQIIETFGEDYVLFFGESPRFLSVSGVLPNSADFNWKNEWWENYDRYLRGTRLVEMNARLYLYFDDVVVEGYIIGSSTEQSASERHLVPFSFQLFVTNYATITPVGSIFFQRTDAGILPDDGAVKTQETVGRFSAGGLSAVMTQAALVQNDGSFSVQSTLENIRAQFLGQSGALSIGPPENRAAWIPPAETGRPIWEMSDEYVVQETTSPPYDQAAIADAKRKTELRKGLDVAKAARIQLMLRGLDPTGRESEFLLLGKQSFTDSGKYGSFGIRRSAGELLDTPLTNLPAQFRGTSL